MKQLAKKLYVRYAAGELVNTIDFLAESPADFERFIKESLKAHAARMAFHKAVMKKTALSVYLRCRARDRLHIWLDDLHCGTLRHL